MTDTLAELDRPPEPQTASTGMESLLKEIDQIQSAPSDEHIELIKTPDTDLTDIAAENSDLTPTEPERQKGVDNALKALATDPLLETVLEKTGQPNIAAAYSTDFKNPEFARHPIARIIGRGEIEVRCADGAEITPWTRFVLVQPRDGMYSIDGVSHKILGDPQSYDSFTGGGIFVAADEGPVPQGTTLAEADSYMGKNAYRHGEITGDTIRETFHDAAVNAVIYNRTNETAEAPQTT